MVQTHNVNTTIMEKLSHDKFNPIINIKIAAIRNEKLMRLSD